MSETTKAVLNEIMDDWREIMADLPQEDVYSTEKYAQDQKSAKDSAHVQMELMEASNNAMKEFYNI